MLALFSHLHYNNTMPIKMMSNYVSSLQRKANLFFDERRSLKNLEKFGLDFQGVLQKDDHKTFKLLVDRFLADPLNVQFPERVEKFFYNLHLEIRRNSAIKCFFSCNKLNKSVGNDIYLRTSFLIGDLFLEKVMSMDEEDVFSLMEIFKEEGKYVFPMVLEHGPSFTPHNFPYSMGMNRRPSLFHREIFVKILPFLNEKNTISEKWWTIMSLPYAETGSLLFKYFQQTKDLDSIKRYINHLVATHPYKSKEMLDTFFTLMSHSYPNSFLLKELKQKDGLPLLGSLTEEKLQATTWMECYPHIRNRLLSKTLINKVVISRTLTYQHKPSNPFERKYYLEIVWDFINKALEDKDIEAQWFLNLELQPSNLITFFDHKRYLGSELLEALELFKSRSVKMKKSLVYHFCADPSFNLIGDTLEMIKKHNVNVDEFAYNLESFHRYHDLLFTTFEDDAAVELKQTNLDAVDGYSILTPSNQSFEVSVPKVAKDLGSAGRFLNICVGNGIYRDKITEGRSLIFFLKFEGKIVYCVEVAKLTGSKDHDFVLLQASGVKNKAMDPIVKTAMLSALKIKVNG